MPSRSNRETARRSSSPASPGLSGAIKDALNAAAEYVAPKKNRDSINRQERKMLREV